MRFDPGTLFDGLAAGEMATIAASYTIQDSHGATATAPLDIFVVGSGELIL